MSLHDARNLGPRSIAMLEAAGIGDTAALRRMGSVQAYLRVQRSGAKPSLNLLWALEGAIRDEPWQRTARERRETLLAALDEAQRRAEAIASPARRAADRSGAAREPAAPHARSGTSYAAIERYAMTLPEVTQAPHHHFGSFRVRGRIFVTVPPQRTHLHVFVPEDRRDEFLAVYAGCAEKLLWGGKVVGLRVTLAAAPPAGVKAMLRAAWEGKAPKALLRARVC
jgi:hypothetical protein